MTASAVVSRLLLAASPSPSPTAPVIDADRATPGLWGLFFFVALGAAVWFLYRSMSKQLKRVSFDDGTAPPPDVEPSAAAPTPPVAEASSNGAPPADPPPSER